MYTFDSRIRYSEVDKNAELTIESLINYFQDCSTFQTQDGPANMAYLRQQGVAWVLNSWQIVINRYPRLCEEVTIGTIPYELKGFFGHRNFFMDTKDGERLATANSVWTLFNFEKGIPARISQEMVDAYPLGEKLPMDYGDRKIAIPEDAEIFEADEIQVRTHHLDTNNHVNNGQYIRMAIESLPDKDIRVGALRAEYRKQAVLGDTLYPEIRKVSKSAIMTYTINLRDAKMSPVCIVELTTQ
ncbi:acyl-[acyl-carrier-protein] thioesterase [Butyrivibrio sp. CB08]|uniref:acyl-[acyl-carrier-protein] thioesterase n=1 Tax=Butyrivibrio sp. CB08 TaxID=2364879 RepID=UPI000EA9A70C|nr:acyl-ACP thioesterase domain-containing protein [Butyrivibrio sp. CB08]RKM59895.1 acyl-[acyl-carrier-protein] thioesterase [Butyrivibrio sp. CB08]